MSSSITSLSLSTSPEPQIDPALSSELDEDIARYLRDNEEFSDNESESRRITPDRSQEDNTIYQASHDISSTDTLHNLSTPIMQRNEATSIARLARRQNLHPYQITTAQNLVVSPLSMQLGTIFIEICALRNIVDKIIVTQPPFTIGEALKETIDSYALAVFLSEKVRAYKGNSLTAHVLAIIQKNGLNIPHNLNQDPYTKSLVTTAISSKLTQIRHRIKKYIKDSIAKDWSIYSLAHKVVEGSQCTISIPLCARLSVMRHVYPCSGGSDFWDKVDSRLELIRKSTNYNIDNIRKVLSGTLKDDWKMYGTTGPRYTIPEEPGSFQQGIDDNL